MIEQRQDTAVRVRQKRERHERFPEDTRPRQPFAVTSRMNQQYTPRTDILVAPGPTQRLQCVERGAAAAYSASTRIRRHEGNGVRRNHTPLASVRQLPRVDGRLRLAGRREDHRIPAREPRRRFHRQMQQAPRIRQVRHEIGLDTLSVHELPSIHGPSAVMPTRSGASVSFAGRGMERGEPGRCGTRCWSSPVRAPSPSPGCDGRPLGGAVHRPAPTWSLPRHASHDG